MQKKVNFEEKSPIIMGDSELPPEYKRFDKPFGYPQHYFYWVYYAIAHYCMFYVIFIMFPEERVPPSLLLTVIAVGYTFGLGATCGAHRYWTHRGYKANTPLRVILMLLQTSGEQGTIYAWVRDHRLHHKYTDTDADPHKSTKGFWFSHIGWLFQERHPDVIAAYKVIETSDLVKDPLVRFQAKYYFSLLFVTFLIVPMSIFYFVSPELTLFECFCLNMFRFLLSVHFTLFINSLAHRWGYRPYDKHLSSGDHYFVNFITWGEGYHNYHHAFPWDYKGSEWGLKYSMSTAFINFFALIGWAYDLKTVSEKHLIDRINRTGDGSHCLFSKKDMKVEGKREGMCWGWGDKDIKDEDIDVCQTLFGTSKKL